MDRWSEERQRRDGEMPEQPAGEDIRQRSRSSVQREEPPYGGYGASRHGSSPYRPSRQESYDGDRRAAAGYRQDRHRHEEDASPADQGYGRTGFASGYRDGYAEDHEDDYLYRGGYGGPGAFAADEVRNRRRPAPPQDYRPVARADRSPPQQRGWWDQVSDNVAYWAGNIDGEFRGSADRASGHYGRGPKGYARSDSRILEDINDRLTADWHLDASEIEVAVSSREVTLTGTVDRREDKRRAEDIAEGVMGVAHVQNNLRVKPAAARTEPTAGSPAPLSAPRRDGGPTH